MIKTLHYRSLRAYYEECKIWDDKVKYVTNILLQHYTQNGLVKLETGALLYQRERESNRSVDLLSYSWGGWGVG